VPPTVNAGPQNKEQEIWEKWIDGKVALDRWRAQEICDFNNKLLFDRVFPPADDSIPKILPADPGPAPEGLVLLAGNPPPFAEAVSPTQHRIQFEDGFVLKYVDHVRMRPKYAYYRFRTGVMSGGTPVKNVPSETLDRWVRKAGITEFQARVMKAVSVLEGGFDSVNTYDTGWVSIGFIQFACLSTGGNSLGQLLLSYKRENPAAFQKDLRRFGYEVTDKGIVMIVDPETGSLLTGADAMLRVIQEPRLVAVFQRAGQQSDDFVAAQIRSAMAQFYPDNEIVSFNLGDGSTASAAIKDLIRTEAGIATIMDRYVNTGKLDPLSQVLSQVAATHKLRRVEELRRFEQEVVKAMKYRKDFLAEPTLSKPSPPLQNR
jgi:hypothetical protein